MRKSPLVIAAALAFLLAGCDNKKTTTDDPGKPPVVETPQTTDNGEDIKADLSLMGEIVNNNEAEVNKLRESIKWFSDKDEQEMLKETLARSRKLQENANSQLRALTLKSKEGEGLRHKLIDSNNMAIKMAELASGETVSEEDKQSLEQLGKQFLALQMDIMQEVNALAVKYNWQ
jgi:predicted RNase H-like nuclease (RuvC/YqgF family)